MCKCGCNTCETKGPLLTEGKVKSLLSEGLQYHIDKKIPLFETVYRIGSDKHLALIKEARKMYSRNIIDLCEEDEALIGTHLGEFALYEGVSIPLDLPMLNEEVDDYDEVAQSEFGMDYDQLGSGEKEWVRDEIDNMSMNEDRKYNQEELLRLDLIARRKFDCDYEKCTDEQKDEILKDKVKVGVKEALNEKEGVPHYTKDGKEWKGKLHKMPDGSLMSGDPHDESGSGPNGESEKLYHKEDLVKESLEEKLKGIDGKACWKGYKLSGTKKKGGKTIDNCVPMKEAKQDIYDKFLDNPSSPKGRAKSLILKFTKEYGDDASSMAVDRFASKNNLKPEEKYILKYITKNDIKISSQSGGPDFSAVSEAEFKGKEVALNKPKRGGPKAYYVYVKDGDKVKKVTFGSGGLRAKIKNKEARNAFAARHKCSTKKDRTKAGYWSCNLPRYAPALGLGAKMNTFW